MSTSTTASPPLPTETKIVEIGQFNPLYHLQTMLTKKTVFVGKSGGYALWITCAIFVLATIVLAIQSTFVHKKSRAFHLVASIQTAIIVLSYYAMATGSGTVYIHAGVEHHHASGGDYDVTIVRQIFYVHIIEFFFSSPLMLLNLALLAGLSWIDVITLMVIVELMTLCVLMGGTATNSWWVTIDPLRMQRA
jgi:bacteriorhodopsin